MAAPGLAAGFIQAGTIEIDPVVAIGRRTMARITLGSLPAPDQAFVRRVFQRAYRAFEIGPNELSDNSVGHKSARRFSIAVFENPERPTYYILEIALSLDGRCCCCYRQPECMCPGPVIMRYRPDLRVRPVAGAPAPISGLTWDDDALALSFQFHVAPALRVGRLPAHRTLLLSINLYDHSGRYRPYSWCRLVQVRARNHA
eukprot:m.228851 g.228851  ORF g.228851 m.228851 type:complete len:201 (+) comp10856_c0_seq29:209-811(+)